MITAPPATMPPAMAPIGVGLSNLRGALEVEFEPEPVPVRVGREVPVRVAAVLASAVEVFQQICLRMGRIEGQNLLAIVIPAGVTNPFPAEQ